MKLILAIFLGILSIPAFAEDYRMHCSIQDADEESGATPLFDADVVLVQGQSVEVLRTETTSYTAFFRHRKEQGKESYWFALNERELKSGMQIASALTTWQEPSTNGALNLTTRDSGQGYIEFTCGQSH